MSHEDVQGENLQAPIASRDLIEDIEIKALTLRNISKETAEKFNYGYNEGRQVACYYDESGSLVAQKVRTKDKKFSWVGHPKSAGLFGQNLWAPNPKKRIVVTEGEIDALSVSQIQDNKWPVVSLPNGAASAKRDIQKHLEYLSGFKEVVLFFDMDEAGRKAALEVAQLLPPNKAYIVSIPMKGANEMLVAGKNAELTQAIWDAKKFKPDGILNGQEILDRLNNRKEETSYAQIS